MDDRPGLPTPAARAVCAACPVRAACLAHALAHDEPWGMWGGLTTRERVAHRLGLPMRDPARPYMGAKGPRKTRPSPKPRKVYPEELQEQAVQRYFESGHSIREVAEELDVHREVLRRWVAAVREEEAS